MNRLKMVVGFACLLVTLSVSPNTLIITSGPMCAALGRSLCQSVSAINQDYHAFSQNDIRVELLYRFMSDLFPEEVSFLQKVIEPLNISYAITDGRIFFKEDVSQEDKEQAFAIIDSICEKLEDPIYSNKRDLVFSSLLKHIVAVELAYYALLGHNVVWESGFFARWEDEDFDYIKSQFDQVIEVVNYCPPTTMVEQWIDRADNAIAMGRADDIHFLKGVLTGFFSCFALADEDQEPVIVLTKDDFDTIIVKAANYIQTVIEQDNAVDTDWRRYEMTLDGLQEFKDELYQRFNFDNVDQVALVPSIKYDMLVSSQEDCLAFAQGLVSK